MARSRILAVSFCLLLSVALIGCGGGGGGGGGNPSGDAQATGKVKSGDTGYALSGVTVSIGSRSASTNSEGSFTLTGVATGNVTVTVQKSGYDAASRSITLYSGNNAISDILIYKTVSPPPPPPQ